MHSMRDLGELSGAPVGEEPSGRRNPPVWTPYAELPGPVARITCTGAQLADAAHFERLVRRIGVWGGRPVDRRPGMRLRLLRPLFPLAGTSTLREPVSVSDRVSFAVIGK